jgi:DNA processing protein
MSTLPSPEMLDLLALTLVPGMGPRLTEALISHFGTASAVRQASPEKLREVTHIGEKLSHQFAASLRSLDLKKELDLIAKYDVWLLSRWQREYPSALAGTQGPPPLLYVRGAFAESDAHAVAIVGSRNCTSYGRRMAERMAAHLARAGVTVISGLARGIDGAAHTGALNAGGRTIAVLAGGLANIYPPEHADLAQRVTKSGCLISETPMTFMPMPGMFPARNRIISGLARGVVVIEAGEKSGALITAQHAGEQGRELFAVPANADNPASAGSLRLLRDGARLVRDADDVLEDLAGITALAGVHLLAHKVDESEPPAPEPPPNLDDEQRCIWQALGDGQKHVDELARTLALPVAQLNATLMMLEMKKVVRRLPGNMYERRT